MDEVKEWVEFSEKTGLEPKEEGATSTKGARKDKFMMLSSIGNDLSSHVYSGERGRRKKKIWKGGLSPFKINVYCGSVMQW